MAANPRLLSLTGTSTRKEVWHLSSRQMLETSGRYFQLTVQSIRRVLDTGSPSHSPRLVAAATEALPVDTWMRRQDLTMRTQSRLLAVIRQAADGAGSKES